jgi:hypothetical protein
MTAAFFSQINRKSQADLLFHQGDFLQTREEPQFLVDVYRLEDFFVEIYFHRQLEDFVALRSFEATGEPQYNTDSETFGVLAMLMEHSKISA